MTRDCGLKKKKKNWSIRILKISNLPIPKLLNCPTIFINVEFSTCFFRILQKLNQSSTNVIIDIYLPILFKLELENSSSQKGYN